MSSSSQVHLLANNNNKKYEYDEYDDDAQCEVTLANSESHQSFHHLLLHEQSSQRFSEPPHDDDETVPRGSAMVSSSIPSDNVRSSGKSYYSDHSMLDDPSKRILIKDKLSSMEQQIYSQEKQKPHQQPTPGGGGGTHIHHSALRKFRDACGRFINH